MAQPFHPDKPLSWKNANAAQLRLLQSLQGNILKGHGRPFVALLFFRLEPAQQRQARRFLRHLANHHVTHAHEQLLGGERFKASGQSAGPFVHLALSHTGYEALGVKPGLIPSDPDFVGGMPQPDQVADIGNRAGGQQQDPFPTTGLHGVVLVADDTAARCAALAGEIGELAHEAEVTVVHVQHGTGLFNAKGEGIEHFGYIDGRSQPLMLAEDVEAENGKSGMSRWNAAFGPGIALVQEPGRDSYGSYLVFRKLEQDVRGFKRREQQLADALHLKGEHRELAGALLVGRFEDGTPVTLSHEAHGAAPPNDFDYRHDNQGARCPFHAHIRKTNDRTAAARHIQMPRRGIPYEDVKRAVHPEELPEVDTLEAFDDRVAKLLPTHGVGLLFMAYNAVIAKQFVAMQAGADNPQVPAAPAGPHGLDPVIGQGHPKKGDQKVTRTWDDPASGTEAFDFAGFVKLIGGEYFFSPSLDFLREL